MKKLLIAVLSIGTIYTAPAQKKGLATWLTDKIIQQISTDVKDGQEERRIALAREREQLFGKTRLPGKKKPEKKLYPELELWYKGYKKRGKSTADLKPLYYKLGYIHEYPQDKVFVTEGKFSTPTFQKLAPSERESSYPLWIKKPRWVLITDKEKPGPGDTLYKFEFPKTRKMLVRIRLVEPGEKPMHTMQLHNKTYFIGPQTGPLKGLKGKTETGIPLKGNVQDKDIRPEKLTWEQVIELPIHTSEVMLWP